MVRREAWLATDLRRNIRHATELPVECRREGQGAPAPGRLRDIGHGGLGVWSPQAVQRGEVYDFLFPGLDYTEPVRGEVVWAQHHPENSETPYMLGVRFLEDGPYSHARLVVDVCHVEFYRRDQGKRHGRQLGYTEAVAEWKARTREPRGN